MSFVFTENLKATLRVDFEVKKLTIEGEEVSLFIWDTAGSERYRSVVRRYYFLYYYLLLIFVKLLKCACMFKYFSIQMKKEHKSKIFLLRS